MLQVHCLVVYKLKILYNLSPNFAEISSFIQFLLLFHCSLVCTKVVHPNNESWFLFSFSVSLSRCLFFFSLGFKMKVVQLFEDLVVDVSRVVLVLHCGIDGVPAFLQTFNCKVRNLSTVAKFWRII